MSCNKNEENDQISCLKQYGEIATCMGITDCYVTKSRIGKWFWKSLIIGGLAITISQTVLIFNDYLHGPKYQVTISKESAKGGILFPIITVCNFNRAKQSVINETNLDPKVLIAMFQLMPAYYDMPLSNVREQTISIYDDALKSYVIQNSDFDARNFFRKYGHNSNESILTLTFGTGYLIYSESFTEVFTNYGRCWRINLNSKQLMPGSLAGAKLLLNPQLNEYMTDVIINNYFQQGFALSLSYNDDPTMSEALLLAPGTSSNIQLKATRNSFPNVQFPIRTKPCRENAKLKIINAGYTPQTCIFDCYMEELRKKCGCILLVETKRVEIPICNVSITMNCAIANALNPMSGAQWLTNIGSPVVECAKDCINPCEDFMTIESTMSTTKQHISNRKQAMKVIKNIGPQWTDDFIEDVVENNIMAKIYFTSAELNVIETGEVPIMTFIGNVGGQLGLWMGISMFSIIQFLYWIFLGCVNGEFCRKSNKVQDISGKSNY